MFRASEFAAEKIPLLSACVNRYVAALLKVRWTGHLFYLVECESLKSPDFAAA